MSSLAFAVGVYVPMQYSVPIFFGGIIRWAVDLRLAATRAATAEDTAAARAEAEVRLIAKTESSPSVLLASGYIAGGSMGGVIIAFFELIPIVKDKIDFSKAVEGSFVDNNYVPLAIFSLLMGLLIVVGMGFLFRSSEEQRRRLDADKLTTFIDTWEDSADEFLRSRSNRRRCRSVLLAHHPRRVRR